MRFQDTHVLKVLVLLVLATQVSAQDHAEKGASTVLLRITQVSKSCWAATRPQGKSNAGFVIGKQAVLVVDALGSPKAGHALLKEIRKRTDLPIRHIVLTHWHYDVSLGAQAFGREARVVMSKVAAAAYGRRVKADRLLLGPASGMHDSIGIMTARAIDERFVGRETFDLGGVKVVAIVVGDTHSAGDVILHVPDEKVLFSGDLVWDRCHPVLSGGSTFRWIAALAYVEKLDIEKIVPGHGEVAKKAALREQRLYLMTLRRLVKHLTKAGVKPADMVGKLEIPKPYRAYELQAAWPRNVAFVHGELVKGR